MYKARTVVIIVGSDPQSSVAEHPIREERSARVKGLGTFNLSQSTE